MLETNTIRKRMITRLISEVSDNKEDVLRLSGIPILDFSEELFELTHLEELHLDKCEIQELPSGIFRLKNLKKLSLAGNNLKYIPKDLEMLTQLCYLDLENNQINQIQADFSKLSRLKHIELNNNQISRLPKGLGQIDHIDYLNIGFNNFIKVPKGLFDLETIRHLDISVKRGPINVKPNQFSKLSHLETLISYGVHFTNVPDEILSGSSQKLLRYFKTLEQTGSQEIYEAKLILVGKGGVGKTTLKQRLIHGETSLSPETTDGIDIVKWNQSYGGKEISINVWDFGGQEIYYSTHQFFLTKRSLYLFIWESRNEIGLSSFDYWLNTVSLLSNESRIIIVLNKIDEEVMPIDEYSVKRKFQNVADEFHKISALKNINISFLRERIEVEILRLPHISDALPRTWFDAKTRISKIRRSFVEITEFNKICSSCGLLEEEIDYFSDYCHDSGTFLHFRDHHILKNIVILEQNWITSAVYDLFKSKKIKKAKGIFYMEDLSDLWSDYPVETHQYLLELAKKFELVFQISNSTTFVATELLPNCAKIPEIPLKGQLRFELRYQFMPSGIFLKLLFRLNDLINHKIYWRNLMVLEREGCLALIKNEILDKTITIQISGEDKHLMLDIIRREIDSIHTSLNSPLFTENINCICSECTSSSEPYFHDFSAVRLAKRKHKNNMQCHKSFEEVAIRELLGEITGHEKLKNPSIYVQGDYYEKIDKSMKIKRVEVKGGQANFADHISKVEFEPQLGIDQPAFEALKTTFLSMSDSQLEVLKKKVENQDKHGVLNYLKNEGIQLVKSVSHASVFEMCKFFLLQG